MVQRLEVHYLANPDPELRFALLSDWSDAPSESLPEDDALVAARARRDPRAQRAARPRGRRRRPLLGLPPAPPLERAAKASGWGGSESAGSCASSTVSCAARRTRPFCRSGARRAAAPSGIRYVITLDADTRLPREAARRLVGTIAHPLNLPIFDAAAGRVVDGHAILQPRVTPTLPETGLGTLFQLVFSGPRGIDPYAFAVSDVYQDLFGEGIYTGKGIYDVDAFERALDDRVPENTQLSHDLFEGLFARAGIRLGRRALRGFPGPLRGGGLAPAPLGARRLAAAALDRRPTGPRASRARSAIPLIGRWKMIDNLRRSLSPPAMFATLLAAWCLPEAGAGRWTLFVLVVLFSPDAALVLHEPSARIAAGVAKRSFLRGVVADLAIGLSQAALRLALPGAHGLAPGRRDRAHSVAAGSVAAPSAGVGAGRAGASRARSGDLRLLSPHALGRRAGGRGGPARGGIRTRGREVRGPRPSSSLWLLSPLVARWVSLPPRESARTRISPEQAREFRRIARRTWRYFETFVGPEYSRSSRRQLSGSAAASRSPAGLRRPTSGSRFSRPSPPTTSAGSEPARWRSVSRPTLATLGRLERFRGHFYNWYDTASLAPLEPRYVSTVDSGNLAAHLITLEQACLERLDEPILDGARARRDRRHAGAAARVRDRRSRGAARAASSRPASSRSALQRGPGVARAGARRRSPSGRRAWPLCPRHAETLGGRRARAAAGGRSAREPGARSNGRRLCGVRREPCARLRGDARARRAGGSLRPASGGRRRRGRRPGGGDGLHVSLRPTRASSFRSVIACRIAPSTRGTTTCWRRRRGWRASSRSRAGTCPSSTGSTSSRPLTPVGRGSALMSWSGSMFEYLMPDLVLEAPSGSLLEQTDRLAVRRQIRYGEERGVPWGISEAAYNAWDVNFTYQYSNFGVSGLGLKRGLSEDLVVAPYATALAAMVEPVAALENFERLASIGALGRYGFYESDRLHGLAAARGRDLRGREGLHGPPPGNDDRGARERAARIDDAPPLRRRPEPSRPRTFSSRSARRARWPWRVPCPRGARGLHVRDDVPPVLRRFRSPHDPTPRTHLLSNGGYCVMMTAAGSGYSRWRGLDVTRWREDTTRDPWGTYVFLTDAESGKTWSAGYQPAGVEARLLRGGLLGRPRGDPSSRRADRDDPTGPRLDGRRRRDAAGSR